MKRLTFIIIGVGLGIAAVIMFFQPSRKVQLPESILQLKLIDEVRGEHARQTLTEQQKRLGESDDCSAGFYFSTDGSGKLSVFLYSSQENAEEQCEQLVSAMKKGEGEYRFSRKMDVQGMAVYFFTGSQQAQYIFVHERDIYWWYIDSQLAQATIQELIRCTRTGTQKESP
jgi:hypothetical protein